MLAAARGEPGSLSQLQLVTETAQRQDPGWEQMKEGDISLMPAGKQAAPPPARHHWCEADAPYEGLPRRALWTGGFCRAPDPTFLNGPPEGLTAYQLYK